MSDLYRKTPETPACSGRPDTWWERVVALIKHNEQPIGWHILMLTVGISLTTLSFEVYAVGMAILVVFHTTLGRVGKGKPQ